MFELRGKYLTSRFYARRIPLVSRNVYEMSFVAQSSMWYKTIPFPTRQITLTRDFQAHYTPRLQKYIRKAESLDLDIRRPESIPDIQTLYGPIREAKHLGPLPPGITSPQENYFYSEVHHPELGRLAAHVSVADQQERIVYGLINISRFRSFSSPKNQRICSLANKFLFHQDMLHFQANGFQIYDMVGVREPMNQMKKEFGGEIVVTYNHIPYIIYALKKLLKG